MSGYQHKEGMGSMLANNKAADNHPDWRGDFMLNGTLYEVAGWQGSTQGGKPRISLKVQPQCMEDCGYWGIDCCQAFSHADDEETAIAAWNTRATPPEAAALRAEVERLREALSPLVAVIPDICNALDLDPDETSIRVRVDGGARDGEVLAERTLTDMLTAARAALEPQS